MKYLVCFLLFVAIATADETRKAVTTMPDDVTLTSGRVLKKVSVLRWEKERVVLKYSGGADPIAFSLIKSIPLDDLRLMRDAGLAAQKEDLGQRRTEAHAQQVREEKEREIAQQLEEMVGRKQIAPGMSTEQVQRAWGRPTKINSSGGAGRIDEQWVYRSSDSYVYFENGIMTSWQQSR